MAKATKGIYVSMGGWPVIVPDGAEAQAEEDRQRFRKKFNLPDDWNGSNVLAEFTYALDDAGKAHEHGH